MPTPIRWPRPSIRRISPALRRPRRPIPLAGTTYVGAAGLTGTITINGVATGTVTTTGVEATDLANVTSAINAISAATGVTATNNGGTICPVERQ